MFQFRRFPTYAYLIQRRLTEYCSAGFPHSVISGSTRMCRSPELIAACHDLLRLLMPRHSPCALSSLTSAPQLPPRRFSVLAVENYAGFTEGSSLSVLSFYPFSSTTSRFVSSFCRLLHISGIFLVVQFSRCGAWSPSETRYKPSIPRGLVSAFWWAKVDSNHRPHDYQSCALAS